MSFSPEMRQAGLGSCFGRLDEKESRYVLLHDKRTSTLPQLTRISSSSEESPVRPTLSILVGATDVLALLTEGTETCITLTFLPAVARYVFCYIMQSVALFKRIAVVLASFLG